MRPTEPSAPGAILFLCTRRQAMNAPTGPFSLPALPWNEDALAPAISARTIGLHYGKHHRTYVNKLNELVAGTPMADMPLERVILEAANGKNPKVFNNAAQAWNHTFFWNCLRPRGGGKPGSQLAQRLDSDLGGYDAFKKSFAETA